MNHQTLPKSSRNRTVSRLGLSWIGMLFGLAAVSGCAALAWNFYNPGESEGQSLTNVIVTPVIHNRFEHRVLAEGEVESSSNVDIRCEVKGKGSGYSTTILWLIPEGTFVQPGEKLIEFESAALREEEVQQRIIYEQARAAKIQTELAFESAKIAIDEYINGTFKQELQTVEAEIVVAEENLRRAEDYARYSEKMAQKGYVTPVQLEADQFAVTNAKLNLDASRTKKMVLENFTKKKTLKLLESDLGTAEAKMLAQQSSFKLEEDQLKEIQANIANCVVYAPSAGQVVYANETDRRGSTELLIEEGLSVRERQVIIRLPDPDQMQVRVKVKESRVGLMEIGQEARLTMDALHGMELYGNVTKVDAIPIPSYYSNVKEYAVNVSIDNPSQSLKPGMSAQVAILVNAEENAFQVPVQSVKQIGRDHFVCLKTPRGPEVRKVQLGSHNDQYVVIRKGVKDSDEVVMNPLPFLEDTFREKRIDEVIPSAIASEKGERGKGGKAGKAGKAGRPKAGEKSGESDTLAAAPANRTPQAMLSRLDADGDGSLSSEEVPAPLQARFTELDKNGNGKLETAELKGLPAKRKPNGAERTSPENIAQAPESNKPAGERSLRGQ
ncbi:Efflux RND transporter periplasmic adaptor subunit [Planctomycetales bacterium 10988]|nr:Efflux RND transporter periplasmic adaptor subunit [Planctomycetales bacterium 10988]